MKVVLVDGSYFCFFRYHAVRRWMIHSKQDQATLLPSDSAVFIDKFKSTFIQSLEDYLARQGATGCNVYIARDGPDIWRRSLADDYKAGRDHSKHTDISFFMRMAYEELFTNALISGVVGHPRLEADDCIALCVRRNASLEAPKDILILTSDYDYLQLLSANVAIVDLLNKNLAASKKCFGNPEVDLFCKVVAGDKSDNIKQVFPRVGPKTALKLFNSDCALEALFAKHPGSRSRFEHNRNMIDFRMIPSDIALQFLEDNIVP